MSDGKVRSRRGRELAAGGGLRCRPAAHPSLFGGGSSYGSAGCGAGSSCQAGSGEAGGALGGGMLGWRCRARRRAGTCGAGRVREVLAGCPCWFAGSGLDGVCGLRRGAAGADASACSGCGLIDQVFRGVVDGRGACQQRRFADLECAKDLPGLVSLGPGSRWHRDSDPVLRAAVLAGSAAGVWPGGPADRKDAAGTVQGHGGGVRERCRVAAC
jgi:hypothetical protein